MEHLHPDELNMRIIGTRDVVSDLLYQATRSLETNRPNPAINAFAYVERVKRLVDNLLVEVEQAMGIEPEEEEAPTQNQKT